MPAKKKKASDPLTAKQQRFVTEYIKDMNQKQAAIRAGYSPKTVRVSASRVMQLPNVKAAIGTRLRRIARKADVGVEKVLKGYEDIAFSNMLHYIRIGPNGQPVLDLSDLPPEYGFAIDSIKSKTDSFGFTTAEIKLVDKMKALEGLGRYHKMFVDRLEVEESVASRLDRARERADDRKRKHEK